MSNYARGGTYKANPVMKRKIDINGNVVSRRPRRPNVSIVQIAGAANYERSGVRPYDKTCVLLLTSQFRAPNPRDAARAETVLNPESWKMLAE